MLIEPIPIIIGDSLPKDGGDKPPSWPTLLFGENVDNRAVGGASIDDWNHWGHWEAWIEPGQTWYIQAGTMDASEDTWGDYRQNMESVVGRILDGGAGGVVIVGSPRILGFWLSDERREELDAILSWQAEMDALICGTFESTVCGADLYAALDDPIYYTDGVHLTALGHQVAAGLIAVPEPSVLNLMLLGLAILGFARRFRNTLGDGIPAARG